MVDIKNAKLVYCGSTHWDWIGRRTAKGAPKGDEYFVINENG
jgi:3-deoxy-D-arabino-heptulosonate 7-phosphate (DAHP) synthase class II